MIRIGWDISHREFTIRDYYYFSKLYDTLISLGAVVEELMDIRNINGYDVAVFNYPEEPFNNEERRIIRRFVEQGGRVIILGYFRNEDHIADAINSLAIDFGVILLADEVIDPVNSLDPKGLFLITSRILHYNQGVNKILLPCTASLRIISNGVHPIVYTEETAFSKQNGRAPPVFARVQIGKGEMIIGGSCVFWDNYSIEKFDNKKFAMNLLLGRTMIVEEQYATEAHYY